MTTTCADTNGLETSVVLVVTSITVRLLRGGFFNITGATCRHGDLDHEKRLHQRRRAGYSQEALSSASRWISHVQYLPSS